MRTAPPLLAGSAGCADSAAPTADPVLHGPHEPYAPHDSGPLAQDAPHRLDTGWQCVSTPAGACASPADWPVDGWLAAPVPGTVAAAWQAAGRLDLADPPPFAFHDHWYRLTLAGHGARRLRLHGLATHAEVWIDGEKRLVSTSMFVAHDLDLVLAGSTTLALCFRSLEPLLAARRTRARWRPRLVSPPTLRNVRTTLLGHMPGWCAPLQAVGPWRPVELLGASARAFDTVDLASRVDGTDGVVTLTLRFVHPQHDAPAAALHCGGAQAPLHWRDAHTLTGELRVPHAERWWPHTHGAPTRYPVTLDLDGARHALGPLGFRRIDVERGDGFALSVNGIPVFCRGACWTTADLVTLAGTPQQLAHAFGLAREAGINMLRVSGIAFYESESFYTLADEYGILIWQDFAFANFDYPSDDAFVAEVDAEARQFLARTRRHASLAVLCGGSEADQQAAMFGLPPSLREQALFTRQLPALVAQERPDVPYVDNSPGGGVWPFSTRTGITHYYGVGAYQRPLDDARRAQVRFAAECLAFANVPDDATLLQAPGASQPHDPRWKAAVPRDPGAGWDFDDVRDHYLATLYGVEPARLRYEDTARYLDLSRAVVADVMGDVLSEWRRAGSTCAGALVWQWQDLRAGAGWGIVDAAGRPKSAWHALAHVLQPVQLLITDEGLNGLDLHLVNDTSASLHAQLELLCLRDGAVKVASATRDVQLAPRSRQCVSAAECLGQFFDLTYAYRFGPRAHDVTIATLRDPASGTIWSQACHFPERGADALPDPDLRVTLEACETGGWQLVIEAQRFARFVHVADVHYRAADNWFHLPPHQPRTLALIPFAAGDTPARPAGEVRALNARAPLLYG